MSNKTRPQYLTALPYPRLTWPSLTPEVETAALSLVLPLFAPAGEYRRTTRVSRGRSRPKQYRKRDANITSSEGTDPSASTQEPEIIQYVTVGLANNLRDLQARARYYQQGNSRNERQGRVVLFCCRAAVPEPAQDSLLLLISTASTNNGQSGEQDRSIRLVSISEESERAIAASLGVPRASVVSISGNAPGIGPLRLYLRETVKSIDVPWPRKEPSTEYLPLKTLTMQVPVKDKPQHADHH